MHKRVILRHIRKNQLQRMILPIILLVICILLFLDLPFRDQLFPVKLESKADFKEAFAAGATYAQIKSDTLYYSGYDFVRGKRVEGHYYYSLSDGRCRFYLLKADADGPESILEPAVLKGKLIYKQDLYTQLVTSMSQSLDWTYQGLASISEPYFFSTVDYTTSKMIVLYAVLATGFAAACLGFLHAFLLLGFPQLTMAILRLRRYGKSSNILADVEKEMKEGCIAQTNTLYLTPHYCTVLENIRTLILPLDSLIWVYRHTILHKFLRFRFKPSYHLIFVLKNGKTYECMRFTKEETETVMTAIAGRYPDVLIGFSDQNKADAKKLMAKSHRKKY